MVLVDSSLWIDHFRVANLPLARLLKDAKVVVHPFVIGELACGRLARRHEVLSLLAKLPQVEPVSDSEALSFIEANGLAGSGVGWVDVHLLASARLARASFYTADKALARVAQRLGLA
jgi:predicted nucleic acid-binding protein